MLYNRCLDIVRQLENQEYESEKQEISLSTSPIWLDKARRYSPQQKNIVQTKKNCRYVKKLERAKGKV